MDNHPIPQDITGFQFKLIGEMTVKQFAYLSIGIVLGWFIAFLFPLPGIVKFPVGFLIAGLGVALAFLPFEGRPLDTMLLNFMGSLTHPNQYLYRKEDDLLLKLYTISLAQPKKKTDTKHHESPKYNEEQLEAFLQALPKAAKNQLDEREMVFFKSITAISNGDIPQALPQNLNSADTPPQAQNAPEQAQSPKQMESQLSKQEEELARALNESKLAESSQNKEEAILAHQKTLSLEGELRETTAQKLKLEQELTQLEKKLIQNVKQEEVHVPTLAAIPTPSEKVRSLPAAAARSAGVPNTPEAPNLITGIIMDSRGNSLPNILIEIKDHEGNPVRAFKTNGLGQFASATSLTNGVYTIEFEDPQGKNKFETIQITASGNVILPLEVISTDEREELRKWLFNPSSPTASPIAA
jgi:PrgI family protein